MSLRIILIDCKIETLQRVITELQDDIKILEQLKDKE